MNGVLPLAVLVSLGLAGCGAAAPGTDLAAEVRLADVALPDTSEPGADPGTTDPGPSDPLAEDAGPEAADSDPGASDPGLQTPDPGPSDPGPSADAGPVCRIEGDHVLGADQLPVLLGGALTYRVRVTAVPSPIPDLQGEPCDAGVCWDLSAAVAGDAVETDVVRAAGEYWFGGRYPADAFVVPLEAGSLAIYRRTASELLMLGMASADEGATDLAYDPPVTIVRLPLKKGDAYETEAEATGHHDGQDYPADFGLQGTVRLFHRYRFLANGQGRVAVPAGSFHVIRLLLDLSLEARNSLLPNPVAVQRFRVYDFLAECVGLVARIRSGEGESGTFFDTATEYRRLGF